jgi:prepilin-type N-terminal cleavage/methylation domain-containing protein
MNLQPPRVKFMIPNGKEHLRVKGFTLIELMVVMLLISIFLGVAIPRFASGIGDDPVKKVSRWMIHTTRTLRSLAIQKQVAQSLVIDLNNHRMWTADESMDEETLSGATEKAYKLPKSVKIVDVIFPESERLSSGTAEILFYPAGYADNCIIHIEDEDTRRFSYLVEPLLPKVKIVEEWLNF